MLYGITLGQAIYDPNKQITTFRFLFSNEQASSLADGTFWNCLKLI